MADKFKPYSVPFAQGGYYRITTPRQDAFAKGKKIYKIEKMPDIWATDLGNLRAKAYKLRGQIKDGLYIIRWEQKSPTGHGIMFDQIAGFQFQNGELYYDHWRTEKFGKVKKDGSLIEGKWFV